MAALDHTQDKTGTTQHRLLQLYPAPDFVKTATHAQLNGPDDKSLPPHVYGDQAKRVYPCHTKAATWMSALYFGDKISELPLATAVGIRKQIMKAAESWGISTIVDQLFEKIAANNDINAATYDDNTFALVWVDANKTKVRRYPLRNTGEVEKAAQWFNQYGNEFTFADRHTIATKIMQKAAEYDAAIADTTTLDRAAGFGGCAMQDIKTAWQLRAAVLRESHPDHATHATKMASILDKVTMPSLDRTRRLSMATVMDEFDRETGLINKYASLGIEAPEVTLFCVTQKVANDLRDTLVQTITGKVYEKVALRQLSVDQVRDWLGDDIATEVGDTSLDIDKLATVVETLPRPDAALFDQMVKSVGIKTVMNTKEASESLTEEELQKYAAAYTAK